MKNRLHVCFLIVSIILFFSGCQFDLDQTAVNDVSITKPTVGSDTANVKLIRDRGVIRYIPLEGGFYGIIGRRGNYDPINLPKAFQQNGLRVEFTAEVVDDMGSIHMWGTLIKLITMKTFGNAKKLIMDVGVIDRVYIQGSPWLIRGTTGTYQAINLPREFRVVGLKVNFVGVIREDIVIIPALWPILEIIEIHRAETDVMIVNLGEEFKLPVGQSALVPKDEILLTFKSVLRDSRCPIGVYCFWQGEAVVLVNVKIGSVDYGDFEMTTLDNPSTINVGAYYVRFFDLYPYPVYDQPVDPASYVGYFLIDSALEEIEPPVIR